MTSSEAMITGNNIICMVEKARVRKRTRNIDLLMNRKRLFGLMKCYTQSEAEYIVDHFGGYDYRISSHEDLYSSDMYTGYRLHRAGEVSTDGFVTVDDDDDIETIKRLTKKED
jgi:hypothetical protein